MKKSLLMNFDIKNEVFFNGIVSFLIIVKNSSFFNVNLINRKPFIVFVSNLNNFPYQLDLFCCF